MGIEALHRSPARPSPSLATRSISICCAVQLSRDRTRCGRRISTYIPMPRGFVYLAVALDWGAAKTAHNRRENEAALVAHPPKIRVPNQSD
jgi:hypothetical protein